MIIGMAIGAVPEFQRISKLCLVACLAVYGTMFLFKLVVCPVVIKSPDAFNNLK